MKHARRLMCILLGALILMGALSGCAERETPEDETFLLRASVCGRIDSLDPAMNTNERAESVFHALYENLMRKTDDGTGRAVLSPGIAKEYKAVSNYDGTVDYIFTLRSTARWSDGTRVKAKDFVYAWRRLVDPATESPNYALLSMVAGYDAVRETGDTRSLAVKAEGDTTFRVTLSAPCAYFLSEVCAAVPTMPLRSDVLSKSEDWAVRAATPGNGPYQIGVWAKDDYLQLRRNTSYYENRVVAPDTLRFVFADDAEQAWRLYEDGRVDYILSPPKQAAAERGEAETLPLRTTACVLYNHMSEAFSNGHVRRAFDLALDRASLAAALGTEAAPAIGLVPYGVADGPEGAEADFRTVGGELCAVDAEGYALRCLDAERELRAGGYWGGEGFPAASCLCDGSESARLLAEAAAAEWKDRLGITVTVEELTREEFDERVMSGEYDLAVDTLDVPCGDAMDYLAPFAEAGANNMLHYQSTPYELLIGVARSSRDLPARAAFLHDAEALLLEDTALSPVCFGGTTYILREGLAGVYHDECGRAYFTGVTRVSAAE